jgi:hypothetical protein
MRTPSVADLFVAKMQAGGYDARVAGDGPPWTDGERANARAKGGGT